MLIYRFLLFCIVCVLFCEIQLFSAEKKNSSLTVKSGSVPMPELNEKPDLPSTSKAKEKTSFKDPFGSREHSGNSGSPYVPAIDVQLPERIRVVAIVHIKGMEPLAVIDIPDGEREHLYYVKKGEVIQYQVMENGKNGTRKKGSSSGRQRLKFRQYYLFIKEITKNSVEIAQKTKPQETRILR